MRPPALLIAEQDRQPERRLFQTQASLMGLEVTFLDAGSVEMDISEKSVTLCGPDGAIVDVGHHDALVVRSYRRFAAMKALARAFVQAGKPVFGADPLHPAFCQDKLCDLVDLASAGLPVPRTSAGRAPLEGDVVKENWGYGGSGVRRFTVGADFDTWNAHTQEFLDAEADWRVLLCNGRALPWIVVRAPAAGDFRTNTHQGGRIEVVPAGELDNARELLRLAEHAGEVLGRPCAGVDLRRSLSGGPCILEVNRTPRLRLGGATREVVRAYLFAWSQMSSRQVGEQSQSAR